MVGGWKVREAIERFCNGWRVRILSLVESTILFRFLKSVEII